MSQQIIESVFPLLNQTNYQITSQATPNYNCIAWAASSDNLWWWPDKQYQYYWPEGISREETISAFVKAYSLLGYSLCDNAKYEKGFEKIAIYKNALDKPTHASRQLPSGHWTSKLGEQEDIAHQTPDNICGQCYGIVAVFMKRSNANFL